MASGMRVGVTRGAEVNRATVLRQKRHEGYRRRRENEGKIRSEPSRSRSTCWGMAIAVPTLQRVGLRRFGIGVVTLTKKDRAGAMLTKAVARIA